MSLAEQIARIIAPGDWAYYDADVRYNKPPITPQLSLDCAEKIITFMREEAAKVAGAQPTQGEAVAALWKLGSAP